MDEPTNGLDIPSKKQFRKIIAGAIQPDQLMIISTHQVKDLFNLPKAECRYYITNFCNGKCISYAAIS